MMSTVIQFFELHAQQIVWGVVLFCVGLAGSVAAAAFVILRLPPNYFDSDAHVPFWPDRPPWQRFLGRGLKNLLGVVLVALGFFMSLPGVPGQGLLTMFIGIVLLDFPGKRSLERRVIAVPTVFRACNRLRARFGRTPLTLGASSEHHPDRTSASGSV